MKSVNKNILREILKTKNRFFSIFTICAIGVGFFSGVRATGSDMKVSADDYYDAHKLFDLRVLSTFGLTENDAEAIAQAEGIDGVFTSKYTDLALHYGEEEYLTRVYSITEEGVNSTDLLEGRYPENSGECIVSYNRLREGMKVGDTVTLTDLTNADEFPLTRTEYTVVGIYNTPMYISITQRGSTTIGDGSLDAFMYIDEGDFTQEVYTEIYVKSDRLADMQSYSEEYENLRDRISDTLEELGIQRSVIRYDEVIGEALEEIADGERELEEARADGQKELDDAKAELEDAAQKIADGEQELIDSRAEIDDGWEKLADGEKELADALTELQDGWAELYDSKAQLDDAEQTFIDSRAELDEAWAEVNDAKALLDDSKAQLDSAQKEIDENSAALSEGRRLLEEGKEQLAQFSEQYEAGVAQYEAGLAEYEQGYAAYLMGEEQLNQAILLYGENVPELMAQKAVLEQTRIQLEQAKLVLDETKAQLDEGQKKIDESKAEIAANEQEILIGEQQLAQAQQQVDEGMKQYNDGFVEYEEGRQKVLDGERQYEEGYREYLDGLAKYNDGLATLQDAQRQYDDGAAEIESSRRDLEDGERQYADGVIELEDAKQQYADGLREYEDGVETFHREIADAERELADAREKISDAGNAEWYIFTREDNIGYAEYESNSQRIDKISAIFPVFFLLVAALVCLTTMSRMIEEQRTQIGTLKALGYTNTAIMRHYMVYAVSAAAAGSLIGAFAGMYIFPWVIIFAYSMMYSITEINFQMDILNILFSAGSMVAAIALTVFFSGRKALAETPAGLMRPKAPKAGKRVLLERIGFIWNRMSFFAKVSGRNLFRYKRRMFMTVVGIAGCTALSLTGFGLKDSITDIVDLQYSYIYQYSGYLAYDSDISTNSVRDIYDTLLEYDPDTEYTRAVIKQYTTEGPEGTAQCYVTAVEDAQVYGGMVDFHERVSGKELGLSDGAIITEKLAKLLGAEQGGTITIQISDGVTRSVTVSGITEHYASHYLYMSEELYTDVFGYAPEYNVIYFTNNVGSGGAEQDAFSAKMLECDGVLGVMMNAGASSTFSDTVKILDLVIVVLIVSAGALAFVVLYNLTNVNITERIREIATLKVLGFYDREVSSYVFRENIILSVMGAAVGLLLGIALCQFVVQTAEIDEVMFGRNIHALSFVWAFLITVAFSLVVNVIMTRILRQISMVESLKSVE